MFEKIAKQAARQLDIPVEDITPETTFESLGVDSLDIQEMVLEFEESLDIELDLSEATISTFGELAELVENQVG